MNLSDTDKSVLFFGRHKCVGTENALKALNELGFEITPIVSKGRGEPLPEMLREWEGSYILCFRSLYILPEWLLNKASIAAINFHPAPPEYPGSGCINFALYDEAAEYGVTAHIMNEKVDNGAILRCDRFPIREQDSLDTLLETTHHALLELFLSFVRALADLGPNYIERCQHQASHEKWNGKARTIKELEALQTLSAKITEEELKRIIRATYTKGFPPKLYIHGYEFALTSPKPIL